MKPLTWRFATFVSALLLCAPLWATVQEVAPSDLAPSARQAKTAIVVTRVVQRYHYKKVPLDDALSEQMFSRYLETLDPNRSFFLKKDIDKLSVYDDDLDDDLKRGELEPAFNIFRTYRKRVDQRINYAVRLLDRGFHFDIDEEYRFDRAEASWALTQAELNEIWRKRVKNDFLNLRLAGKDDDEIRKTLRKRYEGLRRRIHQFDADDVFQSFMNAYTLSLEPHTSYMSASTSENFDISMRLSLEGIGAVLRMDNELTVVQKVISGGPAQLSAQIHAGDRIVGVAQGLDGEVEDVVGWRLQDVVEKIRGPKGSVVRLQVRPKSTGSEGPSKEVTLVRNKIKLEEQAAKKSIVEHLDGMDGMRIGIVEVPTFYRDFRAESKGDRNFRSTTRDVRALINELKQEDVDGIVIDLRQNGGGSLSEATELVGLFIDKGPVVQVKDAFGKVEVEKDPDPRVAYAGPLAVLVDRNSASASEIFAGAIQDYKRGIVIGEPTFGKGTVQTLVDLSRFVPGEDAKLGRLRLTMAQFFRINGGSTQHRGVVPDILFPTAKQASDHGERALDNALPWAKITPAHYSTKGIGAVSRLRDKSEDRVRHDPGFAMLGAREDLLQQMEDRKSVSLMETKRRAEYKQRDEKLKQQRNEFLLSKGLPPVADDADDEDTKVAEEQRKALSGIQLNEAARILADYVRAEAEDRPRAAMRY